MSEKYCVIGLMSGTSLDGLDIVCADFWKDLSGWQFKIKRGRTLPYNPEILNRVVKVIESGKFTDLEDLDREIGRWIGQEAREFISENKLKVDLISSHGQTVYHNPKASITVQLGSGKEISNICNLKVVNDFRCEDVKLGGQGAPLVPIGDFHLFKDFKYCLNLGGIANISIKEKSQIRAFDICICNVGANYFASLDGLKYDDSGALGRKGKLIPELFSAWNELAYFAQSGPKSLDASFFEKSMLSLSAKFNSFSSADKLRTLYEHVAFQLSRLIADTSSEILVTGGGAFNEYLIELMKNKYSLNIVLPDKSLIEFKEALIFGFMGLLRWKGEINVFRSVTGASSDQSAGSMYFPSDSGSKEINE